jgi:hypothetical protein
VRRMITYEFNSDRLRIEQVRSCSISSTGTRGLNFEFLKKTTGLEVGGVQGLTFEDDTETTFSNLLAYSVMNSNDVTRT